MSRWHSVAHYGHLAAGCLASVLVFATSVVGGVFVHGGLPATRRFVARTATSILADSFLGTIDLQSIDRLGFDGIDVGEVVVRDPGGAAVIDARGVHARLGLLGVAMQFVPGKTKQYITLRSLTIDQLEIVADAAPDSGELKLVQAFDPKLPPKPETPHKGPTTPMLVSMPAINVAHVWAHGTPAPGNYVDADLTKVGVAFSFDTEEGTSIDTRPFGLVTRSFPPFTPAGTVELHGFLPSTTTSSPRRVAAIYDGKVGDAGVRLDAKMVGDAVDALLEVPRLTPQMAETLSPGAPLYDVASVRIKADGLLSDLHVVGEVRAGPGEVAIDSRAHVVDPPRAEVDVRIRNLDPRAFAENAPGAALGADIHVEAVQSATGLVAQGTVSTMPAVVDGQAVPGVDARARYAQNTLRGTADVHENGAPITLDYTVFPDGKAVVSADADVGSLAAVPQLNGAVSGSAKVHIDAQYDRGVVDATVRGVAHNVRASSARVGAATIAARVHGKPDALSLDASVDGQSIAAGTNAVAGAQIRAKGALLSPHVAVSLRDPRWQTLTVETDVSAVGGVRLAGLRAVYRKPDASMAASVQSVSAAGGRVVVEGLDVEGNLGVLKGGLELAPNALRVDMSGRLDLAAIGTAFPSTGLTKGAATLEAHVASAGATHHGAIKLQAEQVENALLANGGASGDLSIELDGHALKLAIDAHANDQKTALVVLKAGADATVDGPLMAAKTWEHAKGEVRLAEASFDFDAIALQQAVAAAVATSPDFVPAPLLPFFDRRPATAHAGGRLHIAAVVKRDAATGLPDAHVSIETEQLYYQQPGIPGTGGVPGGVYTGVDLSASAFVTGSRAASGQLAVAFTAHDKNGPVVGGDAFTTADIPKLLDEARAAGKSPEARRHFLERAKSLPLGGRVAFLGRPLEQLPYALRPSGIGGTMSAALDLGGTASAPRAVLDVVASRIVDTLAYEDRHPLDAVARLTLEGDHVDLGARITDERARPLANVSVRVDANASDMIWRPETAKAWGAGGVVQFDRLPLASVPGLSEEGVKGDLSGMFSVFGVHKKPEVQFTFALSDAEYEGVSFPYSKFYGRVGPDTDSYVDVVMEQRDAHDKNQTGALALKAKTRLAFKDGLTPSLDAAAQPTASLETRHFNLKPFTPLLAGAVGQLGGYLDGKVTLDARAQGAGIDRASVRFDGGLKWRQGVVSIPQLGQTFKHGALDLAAQTDNNGRLVASLRNVSLEGIHGKVTGWFDAATPLSMFLGAPSERDGALAAKGQLYIKRNEALPVTYEGTPLGSASGQIDIDASMKGDTLKITTALPNVEFQLPKAKSRDLQKLDEDPDIVRSSDENTLAQVPNAGDQKGPLKVVVDVGIGASLADMLAGKQQAVGTLLIEREDLGLRVRGRIVITAAGATTAVGTIVVTSGRAVVSGKTFYVDHGQVRFDGGDVANPFLDVTARWDVPDGSRVLVTVNGNVSKMKLGMSSQGGPARTQSQIFNLIIFGKDDAAGTATADSGTGTGNGSPAANGAQPAGAGGSSAVSGGASAALNFLVDPVTIGGHRIETSFDTGDNGETRINLVTEVRPNLWATLKLNAPSNQPATPYVDPVTVLLDWRFRPSWSLRTTAGEQTGAVDLIWQYHY